MLRPRIVLLTTTLVLPPALLASPATAQNALGDGQVLDRNLLKGSDGRNMPRTLQDFRASNRIVTGEVGDGREFRGDVGYVGERAFAAPLPSDEFFQFRAGSAASSIQSVLSGASFDRFSLAASGGVFAFDREFTAPPAGQSTTMQRAGIVPERVELDATSRASSFGRVLERSSTSPMVGATLFEGQTVAALGGPVTGLRFEVMPDGRLPRTDLPLMDTSSLADEFRNNTPGATRRGVPFEATLTDASRDDRAAGERSALTDGMAIDGRVDAIAGESLRDTAVVDGRADRLTGDPDYDAIVRRIIEQFGADESVEFSGERRVVDALRQEIDALRDRLQIRVDPLAVPSLRDRLTVEEAQGLPEGSVPADPADPAVAPDPVDLAASEQLLRALRHGRTIEDLTPVERTRLADVLASGESLLAEGQYMLAERYFDRALRMMPKHPMALVGLVNTQIGAGLYLSAAVNLHQLLAAHPEMIDTRYGERILPSLGRIEIAVDALRRRIEVADRVDRVDFGLLLAFIGHQTRDRDRVLDGLAAMRATDPESPLLAVLEKVWLETE